MGVGLFHFSRMLDGRSKKWLKFVCLMAFLGTGTAVGDMVGITYVESAVAGGAVCLDGSPPAYHLDEGYGSGINNWLVQLEGGGWCNNVSSCLVRKATRLGSSSRMAKEIAFSAILSRRGSLNPVFHNWNRVKVRYCDGSSFTGDVDQVNSKTLLHYRGARIWSAVMTDLLAKGMDRAQNALLSGCSAGGLAAIIHCDSFRELLPKYANVKCLSDAGYFIEENDISGMPHIRNFFDQVATLHGSTKNLPSYCTYRLKPSMCFFPRNFAFLINTELFILNAAYDSWQIRNSLVPSTADPNRHWLRCKNNINMCSSNQLNIMEGHRVRFLEAIKNVASFPTTGLFINSCYAHCQTEKQETWFSSDSPLLNNFTIAHAIGGWFYDRIHFQKIDGPYPCDSTCHNIVYNYPS